MCKVFSIQVHSTGACASVMCYVEFAATLFIVPSLLTLAVCVSLYRVMSTEPNSYDNVSASNKTLYPSSQVLIALEEMDLSNFSFRNMLVLSVNTVNVVNLHAFRFCLKKLLVLHPIIEDRKPYQSSAVTLCLWGTWREAF